MTGVTPLYVALALDVSGSMTGAPLQATTWAAQDLVNKLTAVDQAALLTFGTNVVLAAPLSTDHAAISSILQTLRAGGNTLLYDAAHQGVTLLEKTPPGRRAVVLFTDGEDTRSRLTLDDAGVAGPALRCAALYRRLRAAHQAGSADAPGAAHRWRVLPGAAC